MKRFDCPLCRKPLGARLLRHVPRSDRRIAFACPHCGAVLGYSRDHVPFTDPLLRTRPRALATFVGGAVAVSMLAQMAGRPVAFAALAIVGLLLTAAFLLSRRAAYEALAEPTPEPGAASR